MEILLIIWSLGFVGLALWCMYEGEDIDDVMSDVTLWTWPIGLTIVAIFYTLIYSYYGWRWLQRQLDKLDEVGRPT